MMANRIVALALLLVDPSAAASCAAASTGACLEYGGVDNDCCGTCHDTAPGTVACAAGYTFVGQVEFSSSELSSAYPDFYPGCTAATSGGHKCGNTCCSDEAQPSPAPTLSSAPTVTAAPTFSCDNWRCDSYGDDCCAPGDEDAPCSGGYFAVFRTGVAAGCWGQSEGTYTCCSTSGVTDAQLDAAGFAWEYDGGSSDNACREWGYPTEGVWNVDDDCCAGDEQAACAAGYQFAKTSEVCAEWGSGCEAHTYTCTECAGAACDPHRDVSQSGEDYDDCLDWGAIIGGIVGALIGCSCLCGAVAGGIIMCNRQQQAQRQQQMGGIQMAQAQPAPIVVGQQPGPIIMGTVVQGSVVQGGPVQGAVVMGQPQSKGLSI